MTISFLVSNAMNDSDPVGATLPARCSARCPRSEPVGLSFLNFNDSLPNDAPPYLHGRHFTGSTFLGTLSAEKTPLPFLTFRLQFILLMFILSIGFSFPSL